MSDEMERDNIIEKDCSANNSINQTIIDENDLKEMLDALKEYEHGRKGNKWDMSLDKFKELFSSADVMKKSFLARELTVCVKQITGKLRVHGIKLNLSANKSTMINTLSKVAGDGSSLVQKERRQFKVQSLKSLAKDKLKKLKKEYLNIIYAENTFPNILDEWYSKNPFGKYINIACLDCSQQRSWYSCPEFHHQIGYYVFMILDAYHQICGARRLFCLKGMYAAGIDNSYVHRIAKECEINRCGLNSAMVSEPMLDKQSVAFAVATFSEGVQKALLDIGAENEATFCELIREWYEAEDHPGISAAERCIRRLKLRDWLLSKLNIGKFPPCGAYIKDIPIVLFEGLLTGIERRIQLYPFTKSGAYNVRAIGSLDIENIFGGLQDMDPRGTGVLRPDDIATALGVAVELTDARLNPDRGFHMTTSSAKVYPCRSFEKNTGLDDDSFCTQTAENSIKDLSVIHVSDHYFDFGERSRGKRKRKLGNLSKPEEPVRRPTTVREYHKTHEAKILPHVRRGLQLEVIEKENSYN